jgi:Zn finger protein HypA/HybF involved in hydrogenase expression
MSKNKGQNKPNTVSPTQVIFRAFPDACRNLPHALARVTVVTSQEEEKGRRANYVREIVAGLMTEEWIRLKLHQGEAKRRRQALRDKKRPDEAGAEADDGMLLDEIFGEPIEVKEEKEAIPTAEGEIRPIRARSLSFIPVNEHSVVRTRIFPRSFHCKSCGHFVALDSARPPANLRCPCCRQDRLRQEPIVFMCARCATVRELTPRGARLPETGKKAKKRSNDVRRESRSINDFLGGPPPCPDCQTGHIHLEKHDDNNIQRWEWSCNSCSRFHESVQELCFDCFIPAKPADETEEPDDSDSPAKSDIVFMSAFPASAPNALRPLTVDVMFIHDEPLNPRALLPAAREAAGRWTDYFEMKRGIGSTLTDEEIRQIESTCISDAYLLDQLGVITTVYGYRAGAVASHPKTPMREDQRLAKFFRDPEGFAEHVCYGMMYEGAALALALDKDLVIERLGLRVPGSREAMYDDIVERDRRGLTDMKIKDILQLPPESPMASLFRALHSVEHALLMSATQRIGSSVLGSKLFLREGIVLIYEREKVGRGGVVQLANRGKGLLALMASASDHVSGCAQGCADGCPACAYVRDTSCQYEYADLGRPWLPANALLSRSRARRILVPDIPL